MLRRSRLLAALLPDLKFGVTKTDFFTSLWNKPQTRDERVKEYVPEVIEESLEAQRAVIEESTARDVIVELGNKILQEIDNKSPTPSIAPHLTSLLQEYGVKDVIAQRPLSYLLYPNSSAIAAGEQAHELVANFPDNFRAMIEEVERNGCSAKVTEEPRVHESGKEEADAVAAAADKEEAENRSESTSSAPTAAEKKAAPQVIMASKEEYEPMDITMFVKVAGGMAMANLHCGDLRNAVRCVDAGITHAKEASRVGGLYALKAGLLVHQKKFEEAAASAKLAVEASGNVQGYLHGAYALRRLHRPEEAIALLERGKDDHPMNTQFETQIAALEKEMKLALPPSSSKAAPTEVLPEK